MIRMFVCRHGRSVIEPAVRQVPTSSSPLQPAPMGRSPPIQRQLLGGVLPCQFSPLNFASLAISITFSRFEFWNCFTIIFSPFSPLPHAILREWVCPKKWTYLLKLFTDFQQCLSIFSTAIDISVPHLFGLSRSSAEWGGGSQSFLGLCP